jgi:hypothetical protein
MAQRGDTRWQVGGVVVFAVCGLLLVSMGGAMVAAPASLPLLYLVASRRPTRASRTAAAIIGGLTAGELAWAITYLAVRERQPWIWLVPAVTGLATGRVYLRAGQAPFDAVVRMGSTTEREMT